MRFSISLTVAAVVIQFAYAKAQTKTIRSMRQMAEDYYVGATKTSR